MGGMASVHLGRLTGPVGFRRTVAIKHMLESYASNPHARAMLIDEARLAARVNHSNVVQTLDVVEHQHELFLVLEYVHGESLDRLLDHSRKAGQRPPVRVACGILAGVLRGLHAAHEARSEDGQPLELVHRDLSPHNIMVDVHGIARVLDFGVARARGRLQGTQDGQLKGKLAYLSPEQVHGDASRRSDVFTAGVVLWECLAERQLFQGASEADLLSKVLLCKVPPLDSLGFSEPLVQSVLDRALARDPERRFATAREMADALEECGIASAAEIAAWVGEHAGDVLATREQALEALEQLPAEDEVPKHPAAHLGAGLWRIGAVGAFALATLLGALLWVRAHSAPQAAQGAAPAVAPATGDSFEAPRRGSLTPARPLHNPLDQPPTVREVESGPGESDPAASPKVRAPPPATRRRSTSDSPPRPASCNPPFVIDTNGVKRFKVECLR